MKTSIYYFSASGNSLQVAREISKAIHADQLLSMPELLSETTHVDNSDRVGLVFPVYAWGPPRIVIEFLEMLKFRKSPYIFAVVTCVGIPAKTLLTVKKALIEKELDLHSGFAVKAHPSSLVKKNAMDKLIIATDRKRKRLKSIDHRLDEIVSFVRNKKKKKPETSSCLANLFGSLFHAYGIEFFKKAAGSFLVNDNCMGCGTCVRLCPRGNIRIVDGAPVFSDNCEFCHACIQWCPAFSISHPNFEPEAKQYTNAQIRLQDIIVNRN